MRKLFKLIQYIRALLANLDEIELTLKKVKFGVSSKIETPYFQIEGPEYISIGSNSSIGKNAWLACYDHYSGEKFQPSINISNNVRIGNYACITAIDSIQISEGCLFSDYVYISDHSHILNPEINTPLVNQGIEIKGKVLIGANCFLGMRVSVLPGVSLGNNCIIGAHSVVTKSFPAYSMIAGVPARLIKRYSTNTKQWENV